MVLPDCYYAVPLSIGPEPQLLARIAPGIIWVAALLASLLALERLFRDDLQDGSLEQLMLLPLPLSRGAGESDGALGRDRSAAADPIAAGGAVAGHGYVRLENYGADLVTRHSDAGFSRRAGRGVDGGLKARRRAVKRAGTPAHHTLTDFCDRRDGCGFYALG